MMEKIKHWEANKRSKRGQNRDNNGIPKKE